jgi:hypothetical protein
LRSILLLAGFEDRFFTDFCSKFIRHQYGGQFSVISLFRHEFYPFLLRAILGKFIASPGFGFTKKKLHLPLGMVELLENQIQRILGHCNLFQRQRKIYPVGVMPIGLGLSVRDQLRSPVRHRPLELSVQWELNCSKTHEKSPMHTIA